MKIYDSTQHCARPFAIVAFSKLGYRLIVSLMSAGALLTSASARAATDYSRNIYTCGQFRIAINRENGKYVYRSNGLTLTNGTQESVGQAGFINTFRNRNYTYTVQDRADGTGELEVIKALPDGGQDLQVRQECTVQYPK